MKRQIDIRYGVAAAEKALFEQLQQYSFTSIAALQSPVYVLTPTNSLRDYLSRQACQKYGVLLGVEFLSLYEFACRTVQLFGGRTARSSGLFSIAVRDAAELLAQRDPVVAELVSQIASFEDANQALTTSVQDLFLADFQPHEEEVLLDYLQERIDLRTATSLLHHEQRDDRWSLSDIPKQHTLRASIVIRIASLVYEMMTSDSNSFDIGLSEAVYMQAAEYLLDHRQTLPSSAVYIYGLSDATGLVNRFVEALLHLYDDITLSIVKIRDPSSRKQAVADVSNMLIDDYLQRQLLVQPERVEMGLEESSLAENIHFKVAIGRQAELRELFRSIYDLHHQQGVSYQDITVVARNFDAYQPFLFWEASRLGIPFSVSLSTPTSRTRKVYHLLAFLQYQLTLELDMFFSLLEEVDGSPFPATDGEFLLLSSIEPALMSEVRLLCVSLGLQTVADLLRLPQLLGADEEFSIPVTRRVKACTDEHGHISYRAQRRKVPRTLVEDVIDKVQRLQRLFVPFSSQSKTQRYTATELYQFMLSFLEILGWKPQDETCAAVLSSSEIVKGILDRYGPCGFADWREMLAKELQGYGLEKLGGRGAGVRFMTAPEACGQRFAKLFVLGLNRGVFPENSIEDPLLGDSTRRCLAQLLPDLSIRQEKHLIERYMLYQLITGAKDLYLSWLSIDDEGKEMTVSPLVNRLLWQEDEDVVYAVPGLHTYECEDTILPAFDRCILAGVYGGTDREHFHQAFAAYARTNVPASALRYRKAFAASRSETLAELSPRPNDEAWHRLGPFCGLTGMGPNSGFMPSNPTAIESEHHPRELTLEANLYITRVEDYITCPWRHFLDRMLRLEPVDRVEDRFPRMGASVLGDIIHLTLEDIVEQPSATKQKTNSDRDMLEALQSLEPYTIKWPDAEFLQDSLQKNARQALQDDRQTLQGIQLIGNLSAQPFLQIAKELDFADGHLQSCLGAELQGEAYLAVSPTSGEATSAQLSNLHIEGDLEQKVYTRILFKVDRVDYLDNQLSFVDYKSGAFLSSKKNARGRYQDFKNKVLAGDKLQAPAYAASYAHYREFVPQLQDAVGILQYIKPQDDCQQRKYVVQRSNREDFFPPLGAAIWVALSGRALGVHFPRVARLKRAMPRPQKNNEFIENGVCGFCEYRQACRVGDSGFRRRLIHFLENLVVQPAPETSPTMEDWLHKNLQHGWGQGRRKP